MYHLKNILHIAENIYLANLSKNEWRVIPCKNAFSFWYISSFQRSNPLSQKKGSSFGELIITNYDPRPYMTSQMNLFDEPLGEWELKLVHIPKYPPRRKTA